MAKYYGPDLAIVTRVTTDNTPSGNRRFVDFVRLVADGTTFHEFEERNVFGTIKRQTIGAAYLLFPCDSGGNSTLPPLTGYVMVQVGRVHVKPAEYRRILDWGM